MPTVEERAREALNVVSRERMAYARWDSSDTREGYASIETICRLIEEFDAFKQEVSDAMEVLRECLTESGPFAQVNSIGTRLGRVEFSRFIIPKPVDPLVEAIEDAMKQAGVDDPVRSESVTMAGNLRAALTARNIKLVETPDAN